MKKKNYLYISPDSPQHIGVREYFELLECGEVMDSRNIM